MKARTPSVALVSLAMGIGFAMIDPAHAALGGDATSITTEAEALHGTLQEEPGPQYDVAEIIVANLDIREYVNRDGVVFAVSWKARVLPDLSGLLGAYFAQYNAGLGALSHPGLHRSVRVASPDMVVENSGHLRAYAGRAYLPSLIPASVLLTDLR
jgi:hypothetical protein